MYVRKLVCVPGCRIGPDVVCREQLRPRLVTVQQHLQVRLGMFYEGQLGSGLCSVVTVGILSVCFGFGLLA